MTNTKKKEILAKQLRELADVLEKDSVQIKDFDINTKAGHTEGVDPETYMHKTYHPDGEKRIHIDFHLYDKDLDESEEAFDPMDKIREQIP